MTGPTATYAQPGAVALELPVATSRTPKFIAADVALAPRICCQTARSAGSCSMEKSPSKMSRLRGAHYCLTVMSVDPNVELSQDC